jgi:hypothetical protein
MKTLLLLLCVSIGIYTQAQIKLPPPAGGMTVEKVEVPTRRDSLIKALETLAERIGQDNPPVATVLYCLVSYMHLKIEYLLADECIRLTREVLERYKPQKP